MFKGGNYSQEYEEQLSDKISKINSAGLINLRLHNLWNDVNKHARQGQFSSWNSDLDRLWCELAGDVKENNDVHKNFKKIQEELKKISPLINWKDNRGFKEFSDEEKKQQSIQYDKLMEKEVFLRKLQNKQGKGTAYVDPEDDWE